MRNHNRSVVLAAALTVAGLTSIASAVVPVVDGTLDAGLYTRFVTQTVGTQFGDNQSELDAGYYRVDSGKLYLFIAGNLESNNNHLSLFFDTHDGGQNKILTSNPDVDFNNLNNRYGGFTFDTGFSPDYFVDINRDGGGSATSQLYAQYSELNTAGGGVGGFLGQFTVPTNVAANQQQGAAVLGGGSLPSIAIGYNDSNTGGVDGTTNAADATAANAVTTGAEFSFDLAALNLTGDFKIAALLNGGGYGYLSNQALGGFAAGQGNLGSDGNGNFVGDPAGVGTINLNNYAGNQFASVSVTLPTYVYNVNANSNYSSLTAFTPAGVVPTGADGRVIFGSIITAARTVTIDQDISLTNLTFNNVNAYTLAGTKTISIAGATATPAVSVVLGNHVISAPVTFVNDTRVDVAASSSLTLSGVVTATGRNLFKQGAGTLSMTAGPVNSLTVSAGTLKLTGSASTVARGVTVAATGATLDLTGTSAIIDYDDGFSPLAALKTAIASGAITSSTRSGTKYGIGYLDTAALPAVTSYNGVPVDANALVVRATLKGDANLSGNVNFDDLIILAQNYNTTGKEWYTGDFTGEGTVNFDDLIPLAQNYNTALPPGVAASLGAAFAADFALAQSLVPEPTALGATAAAGLLLARRRK